MRISFVLLIVLAGCATTPAGLEPRAPIATYTTTKLPKAIAACLQDKSGPLSLVREGNQASIRSRDAIPGFIINIFDNGVVHVRRPSPLEDEARSLVESCI
jgi:hypothetical protein